MIDTPFKVYSRKPTIVSLGFNRKAGLRVGLFAKMELLKTGQTSATSANRMLMWLLMKHEVVFDENKLHITMYDDHDRQGRSSQ
jgi:hypothetical protein